jgi:hypothetical protein
MAHNKPEESSERRKMKKHIKLMYTRRDEKSSSINLPRAVLSTTALRETL